MELENQNLKIAEHRSGYAFETSMMCVRGVFVLMFALSVLPVWAGWEHATPPPGDECLTNRLGRLWGKPIDTGYLIVDGKYIDAPYIVEQRGYKVFVNGVQVDRLDPRSVLPLPPPAPVTEDPGMPDDLTRDSSLGQAIMDSTVVEKWRYWMHINLYGEERVRAEIEYLSSLPCIARVEDTKRQGLGRHTRQLRLWDHKGRTLELPVPLAPSPPRVMPKDESLYGLVQKTRKRTERMLKDDWVIFVRRGRVVAESGQPNRDRMGRWQDIFQAMAGDMPAELVNGLWGGKR